MGVEWGGSGERGEEEGGEERGSWGGRGVVGLHTGTRPEVGWPPDSIRCMVETHPVQTHALGKGTPKPSSPAPTTAEPAATSTRKKVKKTNGHAPLQGGES